MVIGKILYKIFRKYISAEYIENEIEELKNYTHDNLDPLILAEINRLDNELKIDKDLDFAIKEVLIETNIDKKIPIKSKILSEQVKIRLLKETINILKNQIEEKIIFISSSNRTSLKNNLVIIGSTKLDINLLLEHIRFINLKIIQHKENIQLMGNLENQDVNSKLENKFKLLKEKIDRLELNLVIEELEEFVQKDGELASIKESIRDLDIRDRMGIIHYANFRKLILMEGINLVNKTDDIFEQLIQGTSK